MSKIELPHNHNENIDVIYEYTAQTENFQILSAIFKQLGDSNRLRIFWLLCHCEECVINISAVTQMSSPAVSHHLKLLRASDLITSRRGGKEVYYKAADTTQTKLLHSMIESLVEISCPHNNRNSDRTELIKKIHDRLIHNLGKRFTIEELSKLYHINTSSLKSEFKSVYGLPIAAYMKQYKMKYAAERICKSSGSIADIAASVGYKSQGKFAKAFKDVMSLSPVAYRKRYKSASNN